MRGMGGNITTLVVTVESEVQSQQVNEAGVLRLAKERGVVVRPVLGEIDGAWEGTAAVVGVLVDLSGDGGEFGEEGERVVEGGLPVVGFLEFAGFVEFGKFRVVVERGDGDGD